NKDLNGWSFPQDFIKNQHGTATLVVLGSRTEFTDEIEDQILQVLQRWKRQEIRLSKIKIFERGDEIRDIEYRSEVVESKNVIYDNQLLFKDTVFDSLVLCRSVCIPFDENP
ncbi:MAG: hypothetical protein AAF483_27640, partial [Planctomycetota bacterium]